MATWTEIWSATIGALGADAIKELVKKFTAETGEKIADRTANWISFKLFGIKSEDERRYNEARQAMDPADNTRLNKKLASLDPNMSDWFRIIVMNDDMAKITANLVMYAQMSDADWTREKKVMNLEQTAAKSAWERFYNWAAKRIDGFKQAVGKGAKKAGSGIKKGAVATGKGVTVAAKAVDNEVGKAANAMEPARAGFDAQATRIINQRKTRNRFKRLFGI